mmetsp:Transcript_12911/g.32273  ORF Transcript_12911/g.32273 Transcript_12911/m.32273 type:complete len:465 (+) Transcript_12911:100-1494(+)
MRSWILLHWIFGYCAFGLVSDSRLESLGNSVHIVFQTTSPVSHGILDQPQSRLQSATGFRLAPQNDSGVSAPRVQESSVYNPSTGKLPEAGQVEHATLTDVLEQVGRAWAVQEDWGVDDGPVRGLWSQQQPIHRPLSLLATHIEAAWAIPCCALLALSLTAVIACIIERHGSGLATHFEALEPQHAPRTPPRVTIQQPPMASPMAGPASPSRKTMGSTSPSELRALQAGLGELSRATKEAEGAPVGPSLWQAPVGFRNLCPEVVVPAKMDCQLHVRRSGREYLILDLRDSEVLRVRFSTPPGGAADILELVSSTGEVLAQAARLSPQSHYESHKEQPFPLLQLFNADHLPWGEVKRVQRGAQRADSRGGVVLQVTSVTLDRGQTPLFDVCLSHTDAEQPLVVRHCPTDRAVATASVVRGEPSIKLVLKHMSDAAVVLCAIIGYRCLLVGGRARLPESLLDTASR